MEKSPFPPDGGLLIDPGGLPGAAPWSAAVPTFSPSQSAVESNLTTVDDIKDQLRLLVNEIRSLRSRLDEMEASSSLYCGFDPHCSLPTRKKTIDSSTSLGRRPAKASALLVILILEALSEEPKTERSIKEYVVEQCRKCNVKVSSKGSITGSSLEVSTVCAILAGLGLLEFSPTPSGAAADTDRERLRVSALANTLRERHELVNIAVREREQETAEPAPRPEAAEIPPRADTPSLCQQALEELKIIEKLDGPQDAVGGQKDEFVTSRLEETLPEVVLERDGDSAAVDASETVGAEMEFEELDMDDALSLLDKETEVERETLRQESTEVEGRSAAGKDTNTKKTNPVKLWRIVKEKEPDKDKDKERTGSRRSVCMETDALLNDVSQAVYLAQRTQEVEEKLLRRVATQCRLILPSQPLLLGTRYLDPQYEDVRPPAQSSSSSSSSAAPVSHPAERDNERESIDRDDALAEIALSSERIISRDLLELPTSFTAQSLLQKVMSAKRERGLSLPVSQSAAVNASLPSTVNVAVFDARPIEALRRICERTKDALWRDGANREAADECAEKRERSRKRTLSVADRDGDVLTLYDWMKTQPSLSLNASTANVLSQQSAVLLAGDMPSLSVSALKRYNPPLALEEAPSSVVVNKRYVDLSICCEEIPWSVVAKEFEPIERDENDHEKEKEKKTDKSETGREPETVEAPMFREVESVDEYIKRISSSSTLAEGEKASEEEEEEEEEDISDEAVLARHEFVLRGMREKWALMQRLKQETRADSLHGSLNTRKGNHGSDGEIEGDRDAPTKKRGRPPKMPKLSQLSYSKS